MGGLRGPRHATSIHPRKVAAGARGLLIASLDGMRWVLVLAALLVPAVVDAGVGAGRAAYVGAGVDLSVDGTTNPLTNDLWFGGAHVEAGVRVGSRVWLGGRVGLGRIDGDETTGHYYEAVIGPDLRLCGTSGRHCLRIGVETGVAVSDYRFKEWAITTTGIIVQPRLTYDLAITERLGLDLSLGLRTKWIVSTDPDVDPLSGDRFDREDNPQMGPALGVAVLWRF
jgi:hypothetical protein